MKTVSFYTLGCKLNFSETSSIATSFSEAGYTKTDFQESADVYVINTCSVTDNADKKCRKVVREALKLNPKAFIAIIGCYAQLKPLEISEIPGVDIVLGASEKFNLLDKIENYDSSQKVFAEEVTEAKRFNHAYSIHDRTRTFLKVQDGCNYKCAFCTIPLARGKSRSDSIANIIKSAEEVAKSDTREVVLTGVNIGDFGIVEGKRQERFVDLVRELDKVKGIERYRISSIEPNLLSNEIIDIVSESDRFMPHFHIPLQSGSDVILVRMRRRYRSDLYRKRVDYIRSQMPNASIGVDVITGFPGETEEEFLKTYQFLNELDVSYLHVFTYSERDNTDAISMDGVVPAKVRNERSKMLRSLSEKKKRAFYERFIGQTSKVLFEADVKDGKMYGFTENYLRCEMDFDPLLINEIVEVKLNSLNPDNIISVFQYHQPKVIA